MATETALREDPGQTAEFSRHLKAEGLAIREASLGVCALSKELVDESRRLAVKRARAVRRVEELLAERRRLILHSG